MITIKEFPNLVYPGLELFEYSVKHKGEDNLIPIKINEFFPKIFKFRCIDNIKRSVCIKRSFV